MSIGLLGKKIGMTRIYDQSGAVTPVTVVHAGGNRLVQTRTADRDGYTAVQIGYDDQKAQRITKPLNGHFAKHNAEPCRFIKEFRTAEEVEGELDLSVKRFAVDDMVDVIGQSKGKGFQGPMKRHNFAGQGASHGSKMHRRNGAIGNRSTPGRVWKNMGMAGHMGDERVTTQNLRVVAVNEEEQLILISGAIPGANGSYVTIRPAIKAKKAKA
ncbi:MAG: 50S ribosomal protein L3 [Verrucomicrobiales bacterium]